MALRAKRFFFISGAAGLLIAELSKYTRRPKTMARPQMKFKESTNIIAFCRMAAHRNVFSGRASWLVSKKLFFKLLDYSNVSELHNRRKLSDHRWLQSGTGSKPVHLADSPIIISLKLQLSSDHVLDARNDCCLATDKKPLAWGRNEITFCLMHVKCDREKDFQETASRKGKTALIEDNYVMCHVFAVSCNRAIAKFGRRVMQRGNLSCSTHDDKMGIVERAFPK